MAEQWQEQCAARMTRTLARQPRNGKTRAYLATLPKRPAIVVSPDDFQPVITRAEARANDALQVIRDAQRYADWEQRGKPASPTMPRKDRLRPKRHKEHKPLLAIIATAQAMACSICGEELAWGGDYNDPLRATYDHVVPRALGGPDHNNRVAAHRECNRKKADRPPTGCENILLAAVNAHLELHYSPPAIAMETRRAETVGSVAKP